MYTTPILKQRLLVSLLCAIIYFSISNLFCLVLNVGSGWEYTTIQSSINAAFASTQTDPIVHVRVHNNVNSLPYTENLLMDFYNNPNTSVTEISFYNFTDSTYCTIIGQNPDSSVVFINGCRNSNISVNINGFKFNDAQTSNTSNSCITANYMNNLNITNCEFSNCYNAIQFQDDAIILHTNIDTCTFNGSLYPQGRAVLSLNHNGVIMINNCNFQGFTYRAIELYQLGITSVQNLTTSCTLTNNYISSGDVILSDRGVVPGKYTVSGNKFFNPSNVISCGLGIKGSNVLIENNTFWSEIMNSVRWNCISLDSGYGYDMRTLAQIRGNLFYNSYYCIQIKGSNSINWGKWNTEIDNNTFYNYNRALIVYYNYDPSEHNNVNSFMNNLFISQSDMCPIETIGNTSDEIYYPEYPDIITASYSCFSQEPVNSPSFLKDTTCFVGAPMIDWNMGNHTYSLLWTENVMSPCIDAGSPQTPKDPDGTPADIGAISAQIHAYWKYTFRDVNPEPMRSEPWHWVSYPVRNSITNGALTANAFFHELLGKHQNPDLTWHPDVLEEIMWCIDGSPQSIVWDANSTTPNWSGVDICPDVTSQQGYKIQLKYLPENAPAVILHHSGFQTSPTIPIDIYGSADDSGNIDPELLYENWIGYNANVCSQPWQAFASIWNDIVMIKAKDWCIYRMSLDGNDYFSGIEGTMRPLICGDMVVVVTRNDHPEFQWNVITPVEPIFKPKPEYFTYEEKPDYVPVTITMNGIDRTDLKEIGLKLDGEFKGAVVVENDVEQLCAYLGIDEKLTEGVVELILYYNYSTKQQQEMISINVNNSMLKTENIGGNANYPVYNILLNAGDLDNVVIPALSLAQNYPNPFNPSTRIGYSLNKAGNVSLDIFNIKGQLVKTLFQGYVDKGSFTTTWNGTDNMGNACSSGIYFYKLRTQDKTLVRKMMLMK